MDDTPRAPALADIRERWAHAGLRPGEPSYTKASADIPALLEIIDAQAARLAAVAQIVFTHEWHVSCCPLLTGALDDALAGASDG